MLPCLLLDAMESSLACFARWEDLPMSLHGVALTPEDVGSTRGLLPLLFRQMQASALLCRPVLSPEAYGLLFGWTSFLVLESDPKTLTGERLTCRSQPYDLPLCSYFLLASLHQAFHSVLQACRTEHGIHFDLMTGDSHEPEQQPE